MVSFPHIALAGDGNRSIPPKSEGIYSLDEDLNIRLVEEVVTYNIKSYDSNGSKADVTVQYQLENPNNNGKNVRLFFIINAYLDEQKSKVPDFSRPKISDVLKVSFNGKDITENCIYREEVELLDRWIRAYQDKLVDPISKKKDIVIYDREGPYFTRAQGIEIPFTLSELEKGTLEIQYSSTSGYDQKDYYRALSGYIYNLIPPNFGSGESKITLWVNFPQDGRYAFYSNIPMSQVSKNSYETSKEKQNTYVWRFTFFEKSAISFGTNYNLHHTIYTSLTALTFFSLMLLISFKLKKRWMKEVIRPLAYIVSFLFFNLNINVSYSWSIRYAIFLLITAIVIPSIYLIRSVSRIMKFIKEKN